MTPDELLDRLAQLEQQVRALQADKETYLLVIGGLVQRVSGQADLLEKHGFALTAHDKRITDMARILLASVEPG